MHNNLAVSTYTEAFEPISIYDFISFGIEIFHYFSNYKVENIELNFPKANALSYKHLNCVDIYVYGLFNVNI